MTENQGDQHQHFETMWEEILKAITLVYLPTMLKVILGPLAGYAAGLNVITTIISTVAGMMTIVVVIIYFENWFKKHVMDRFFPNRKHLKVPNPKLAALWKKFGLTGVAFFTPLFLTPIGGTLLAVSSGSPRDKIIRYMFVSALGWSIAFSVGIYLFFNEIKDWINYINFP